MPAQQVVRAAPRMVSVKTSSSHSPNSETPGSASGSPNPTSDNAQFAAATKGKPVQVMMPGQAERSAQGSVKSNASYGKAQQVTVVGGKGKARQQPVSREGSQSSKHAPGVSSPLAEAETTTPASPPSLAAPEERNKTSLSPINASPASQPAESPFFDASEMPPSASAANSRKPNPYASMTSSVTRSREDGPRRGGAGGRGPGGLSAVIEEATKRASRVVSHEGLGGVASSSSAAAGGAGKRESSPFDDKNRVD